jgi:peptidoglycan/LPS O-acetylase OafA/YrhL
MAAAALYVVNFDFAHPWFLGHLWSVSVQEQFYFLWPCVLRKWYRHRVKILLGVIAFSVPYRVGCHLVGLHGRADQTFPAVADILAIGCLLAIFGGSLPKIEVPWTLPMVVLVVLVPVYMGVLHFHLTPMMLLVFWPALHLSIAGLLLHAVQTPHWILNVRPVTWLGKISYGLYLWQQLFVYGEHSRPWYLAFVALALASVSYHLLEKPMLRVRDWKSRGQKLERGLVAAA